MKNEKKTQVSKSILNVSYNSLRVYKNLKRVREEGLDVGMFYMLFELNRLGYRTNYSCSGHYYPERFYVSMDIPTYTNFGGINKFRRHINTKDDIIPIDKFDKPYKLLYLEKAAEGLFKIEEEPCFLYFINDKLYSTISLDEQNIDIYFKYGLLKDKEHESLIQMPVINVCIRILDEMRDSITFDKIVEKFNEMIRRLKEMWHVS